MDNIAHHMTALTAITAVLIVPALVILGWNIVSRARRRRDYRAMKRGNLLYREWLSRSEQFSETGR